MKHMKKYQIEDESFEDLSDKDEGTKKGKDSPLPKSDSLILSSTNDKQQEPQSMSIKPQVKAQTQPAQDLNNISDINLTNLEMNDESLVQNNNFHHIQIIDDDVENFKRRLDIMIKNFRTDTLKDFMGIKRNLLIEQKTVIESERQKCEALLSSKGDLVEHLKEDLAKTQRELAHQMAIKEKLSLVIFNDKHSKYQRMLKQKAFSFVLKRYHDKKKSKKMKEASIRRKYHLRLKAGIFDQLKLNWKEMKLYKVVSAKEKECQDKLNEMAQYYGKEIFDLKSRLQEANMTIEKTKEAKNAIQENLKKVLMRGVMAMNMEAMSVLDKNGIDQSESIGMNIMNPLLGNQNRTATPVSANQNFTPSNTSILPVVNTNQITPEVFDPNPIVKDSNWINASSVPMNMKTNLLEKETHNEYSHDMQNSYSDFNEEEINSRHYDFQPMNQIENKYKGMSQINNLTPLNINSNNNYFEEMQKNLSNIKDEFSSIKQNSLIEDSFNTPASPFINNTAYQLHGNANDIGSKVSNNSTVSNTNIINQPSVIKGQTTNLNTTNKKKGIQVYNKGVSNPSNDPSIPKGGSSKGKATKK